MVPVQQVRGKMTMFRDGTLELLQAPPAGLTITYRYYAWPYDIVASDVAIVGLTDSGLQTMASKDNKVLVHQVQELLQAVMNEDRSYWARTLQLHVSWGRAEARPHPAAGRRQEHRLGIALSSPSPRLPRADLKQRARDSSYGRDRLARGSLHPAQVRASRARTCNRDQRRQHDRDRFASRGSLYPAQVRASRAWTCNHDPRSCAIAGSGSALFQRPRRT
jgi:hypothetical protein